jgi:hypothetical protein
MKKRITDALTKGLLAGYGGKTKFDKLTRGGFEMSSSHFYDGKITYHDEWTNNGGQEIVKTGKKMFTRVYAGGAPAKEVLEKLGISEKQVIENLIERIKELGDKTRLFENCIAKNKNDWDYEYKILDDDKDTEIVTGKEIIRYKNKVVFIHVFVLSLVK